MYSDVDALTQLLHKLLVLVQLLQVLDCLVLQLEGGCLLTVLDISEHTDLHAWAGDEWQTHGS